MIFRLRRSAPHAGVVRNLRRSEQAGSAWSGETERDQVISFRLEISNEAGEVAGYLPVEMRGRIIVGDLADGDSVRMSPIKPKRGLYKPTRIENETTGNAVFVKKSPIVLLLLKVVFLVAALSFIAFTAFKLVTMAGLP